MTVFSIVAMPGQPTKKKPRKRSYQSYSRESLQNALEAVVHKNMSQREASKTYGVPQGTISDYIKRNQGIDDRRPGRKPVFSPDTERKMVKAATDAAQMGLGLSRYQFMAKAGNVARQMNIKIPGKHGFGPKWLHGIRKRNQELTIRKPEALSSVRAKGLNNETVGESFVQLYNIYRKYDLFGHPERIHNMDESHCSFQHKPTRVLANCTFRNTPGRVADSREGTTFVTHACANGTYFPPLIIVRGKTPQSLIGFNTQDGPKGSLWTYQQKAWTEDILGVEWFNFYYKHLEPKPTKDAPHLLIVDSHGTHETSGLIAKARSVNVEIFSLPGHTTHYLQPLDRTIFKPFKTAYDRICSEYLQNSENVVSKVTWPGLFRRAFEEAMIPPNILAGFAATGIYPWNPLAIPVAAFLPCRAFNEGSMQPVTNRHPLAWVMDKISEAEATISLEASDNNVLSILRSSIENVPSTSDATPTDNENNVTNSTASAEEGSTANSPSLNEEHISGDISSSSISPIIPLESGIRLEDLLEPEVQQFLGSDLDQMMANTTQNIDKDGNVVSVDPVINFDPQANYTPLDNDESLKIINEVFTPKSRGKVRTRGGIRGGAGRGGKKGILSQSRPRLLTSDEIFNIKVEQEKEKQEKKKRIEEKKKEKIEYHLKQLAKLQK